MSVADNLLKIKKLMAEYAIKYNRSPESVALLGACKAQSFERIEEAVQAGLLLLGENYLQEALIKMEALNNPAIEWHFIGNIQKNKTRKIAEHFNWVETIDDVLIAKRLHEERPEHLPPLNILIEVNISNEPTKSGVHVHEVKPLADACMKLSRLSLRGLMAIPAPKELFEAQRAEFHKVYVLWQSLRDQGYPLDTLSMGMSNDFEAAIAEGATIIRLGTKLFGERSSN